MPINLTVVEAEPKTNKRYTAIFRIHKGGKIIKITNFGQIGGTTYIDEGNKDKRKNYIARHKKDLDTNDYKRAGYLSMFLLWGKDKTLKQNLINYKKKFNLT